ncbi:MAG: helix-turn-helix domain-containing protein [Clostridia bacterium]|nr:helix-turn-helix domain-containing protein [Clostridia bacterium]
MSDKKKIDRTLGDKIYDLRTSGNYSQEYVGRLAGVSRQTVSKWEANYSQPKYENLKQLCNALDVDISYMTSNEDIKAEENNKETLTESEVVCDEVANSETQEVKLDRADEIQVQESPNKPNNKRKLSKKSKIIIASVVIAVVLLVGIAMIIFDYLIATPMKEGAFGGEVMVEHNFSSIENIGWICFGVSFAVAVIMGIILIVSNVKNKKTNDKISGSKP